MTDPRPPAAPPAGAAPAAGATPIVPQPWAAPAAAAAPTTPGPWRNPPAAAPAPPPSLEDQLGKDDRDILAEYRAQYAAREAKYAECQEEAKAQQAKRDEEQAQIDADWADPTKRRPRRKPRPRTSVRVCRVVHPKISCVPSDANPQGAFGADLGTALNTNAGTSIDFATIAKWEGGVHLNAYQPWFPDMTKQADGTFNPRIQQRSGQTPRMDGPMATSGSRNRSGATVGKGIDFGPQENKSDYFRELKATNNEAGILTDAELQQLKDKIDPYMGKRMAEGCLYLRAHPLTMTQKELDLLHYRAATKTMGEASGAYRRRTGQSFDALPAEAQTALFSRQYQTGRPPSDATLDLIAAGNYATASTAFTRESSYLATLGNAPAPAPPAGTPPPPAPPPGR